MKRFWSSYIYILIPFIALIFIKYLTSSWVDVVLSTDWSIASFMIYAQSMGQIMKASINRKDCDSNGMVIFIGMTIVAMIPSLSCYYFMNTTPNLTVGWTQIALFVIASVWLRIIFATEDKFNNQ